MKRKKVLNTPLILPTKEKETITVQESEGILILNYWKKKNLIARYAMNLSTGEYETYNAATGTWSWTKLATTCTGSPWYCIETPIDTEEQRERLALILGKKTDTKQNEVYYEIQRREEEYSFQNRQNKENRRLKKIKDLMERVPALPEGFEDWIWEINGGKDYGFYDKASKYWTCTACGRSYPEEKKIRHNDFFPCPECGKEIQAKKRNKEDEWMHAVLLQEMDETRGIARHFDAKLSWKNGKSLLLSEGVRLILPKGSRDYAAEIYWNQCRRETEYQTFDYKHNPSNRRMPEGFLYPEGIAATLKDTSYEPWSKLFSQMAKEGKKLNYNRMMCAYSSQTINMVEYLYKGRFHKLLRETVEQISTWTGNYTGILNSGGQNAKEVFRIQDQQRINRIRDCDGGINVVEWMRWSEQEGEKINDETLQWLAKEEITSGHIKFIQNRMSLRQIMNYVKKQQADGYKGKSARSVLDQWEDYLRMCDQEGKDTSDEMIYRPRELKRRHNEMVEEIRKRQMIEQMKRDRKTNAEYARRMRKKFPGAEENLKAVRKKFEYENEEYQIIVPKHLTEIVAEGNALHHCAGASERYFERIMNHETYICFLRKANEPNIPFYTIEVEPGGTIRQHRSYFDEEPGIKEIRGFLKEWQREVRKRMTEEDKKLAAESAEKREKNLEELKAKNNTRVLQGLMEDFMEAI